MTCITRVAAYHTLRKPHHWSVWIEIGGEQLPTTYLVYHDQLRLIQQAGYDVSAWYNVGKEGMSLAEPIYCMWSYVQNKGWRIASVEGEHLVRTIRGRDLEQDMTIIGNGEMEVASVEKRGAYYWAHLKNGEKVPYPDNAKVKVRVNQ